MLRNITAIKVDDIHIGKHRADLMLVQNIPDQTTHRPRTDAPFGKPQLANCPQRTHQPGAALDEFDEALMKVGF